jgi:HlyD family secretion protein
VRAPDGALARAWRLRWRIAAVLAAMGAAGYFAFLQIAGPRVEAARVVRRDVVQSVVASGRIVTPHRVEVGAQVTGTVAEVAVEKGDTVKAGQRLLALEASEARAAERQAQATLENARAQLQRNRRLHEKGFVGEAALEDSTRAEEIARRQLEAARARLAYMVVKAPTDGTLITREVDAGDVVQPGKVLMTLSPDRGTEIVLQVDERNLGRIRLGQRALASADAYAERRFGAELTFISPGVDAQRGTVEVKLRVPQPPDYLKEDMTVSVDIETERRAGALTLPADAVHDATGPAPWVLAVEDGRAVRRPVKLGLRGERVVEIVDGLAEGGLAVPVANGRIRPGQAVRALAHD